jgi:glycosyltransferase involved in cell wall biosynthesis
VAEPFSLLLPIYAGDKPDQFARAFHSTVRDQTVPPDEVVVVRDGVVPAALTDRLAELFAETDVPVRLVEIDDNVGLATALERGLDACAHEIVARMDADDVSLPERFAKQLALLETGLDMVGGGMYEFSDDPGTIVGTRVPPTGQERIAAYARFHDPFNHPTVVYRKSAVRRAGGYHTRTLMEDYSLFARMVQSGARVDNVADPVVMYRVGDGAYARRGGVAQLRAELGLQWEFRRIGFTTRRQALRNVLVRGGYRLVPQALRRFAYRRIVASGQLAERH